MVSLRSRRIVAGSCGRRWISGRTRIHAPSRIGAVRHRSQSRRMGRDRLGGHRTFRIQEMVVARPQPKADQSARIRHRFRLPAMVGLIAPHGLFTGLIPCSTRFAAQVVLADQCFLNRLRPLGLNLLLASRRLPLTILPRAGVHRPPGVRRSRCTRLCGRRGSLRFGAGIRGTRTSSRLLRQRRARRNAATDQRQSAACAQPSPHFRALLRLQGQPSNRRRSTVCAKKTKNPTGTGIVIILH
jgi:hypothetical protein